MPHFDRMTSIQIGSAKSDCVSALGIRWFGPIFFLFEFETLRIVCTNSRILLTLLKEIKPENLLFILLLNHLLDINKLYACLSKHLMKFIIIDHVLSSSFSKKSIDIKTVRHKHPQTSLSYPGKLKTKLWHIIWSFLNTNLNCIETWHLNLSIYNWSSIFELRECLRPESQIFT